MVSKKQVDQAVEACLIRAYGSDRPFQQLGDVPMVLHSQGWPKEAIMEVEHLVVEGMAQHRYPTEKQQPDD